MKRDIAEAWAARLELPEMQGKQLRGALGDVSGNRCCLGVLCDMAVEQGIIPPPRITEDGCAGDHLRYGSENTCADLPIEVLEWAGMEPDFPSGPKLFAPTLPIGGVNAAMVNDDLKFTFAEIAAVIRANMVGMEDSR